MPKQPKSKEGHQSHNLHTPSIGTGDLEAGSEPPKRGKESKSAAAVVTASPGAIDVTASASSVEGSNRAKPPPAVSWSITEDWQSVQTHAATLPRRTGVPPPLLGIPGVGQAAVPCLPPAVARTMALLQQREVSRAQQAAQHAAVQEYLRSLPPARRGVSGEDEAAAAVATAAAQRAKRRARQLAMAAAASARCAPGGLRLPRDPSSDSLASEITPASSTPRSNASSMRSGRPPRHPFSHRYQVEVLQRAAARVQPGSPRTSSQRAAVPLPFAVALRQSVPSDGMSRMAATDAESVGQKLQRHNSMPPSATITRTASWVQQYGQLPPEAQPEMQEGF